MRMLLVATIAALFVPIASAKATDPRVCDQHPAAYCAEFAASILVWKAAAHQTGSLSPYRPDCVPAKPSLLKIRCFLIHGQMSGPAATVLWTSTFVPTVSFGPAAIAYMADLKAKIAAAQSG